MGTERSQWVKLFSSPFHSLKAISSTQHTAAALLGMAKLLLHSLNKNKQGKHIKKEQQKMYTFKKVIIWSLMKIVAIIIRWDDIVPTEAINDIWKHGDFSKSYEARNTNKSIRFFF